MNREAEIDEPFYTKRFSTGAIGFVSFMDAAPLTFPAWAELEFQEPVRYRCMLSGDGDRTEGKTFVYDPFGFPDYGGVLRSKGGQAVAINLIEQDQMGFVRKLSAAHRAA